MYKKSTVVQNLLKTPMSAAFAPLTRLSAALLAVSLAGCGLLQRDDQFQSGFYVAGGVGVSNLEPDTSNNSVYSVDESMSEGGQVAAGFDVSSRFSLEIHGADLGAAQLAPDGEIGYEVMGGSVLVYGLNDRYARNRRTGFSGFGRLGVGSLKNQSDVPFNRLNDVQILAGAGLEYGFENGFAIRGEAIAFDTDAQYAQLGLVYRLGDRDTGPDPRNKIEQPPAIETSSIAIPDVSVPSELPEAVVINNEGDLDSDGVLDFSDECPQTAPGMPVDDRGCGKFEGVVEGVNFEVGASVLTPSAESVLRGVAAELIQVPELRLIVEAHTDNQGSASNNLELSKQRALSVARFLVAEGVDASRLQPQAFGESKPMASNKTAAGRASNRRVEFKVLQTSP